MKFLGNGFSILNCFKLFHTYIAFELYFYFKNIFSHSFRLYTTIRASNFHS